MGRSFDEAAVEKGLACSACGVRLGGESYRIGTHGERLCKGCYSTLTAHISQEGVVSRHMCRYNACDEQNTPQSAVEPVRSPGEAGSDAGAENAQGDTPPVRGGVRSVQDEAPDDRGSASVRGRRSGPDGKTK